MEKIAGIVVWVIVIQGLFLGLTYIFAKKLALDIARIFFHLRNAERKIPTNP